MPRVEYIAEKDAPKPPKPLSKAAQEIMEIIQGIKPGQVAQVEPDEGQSLRGMKVSFGRVASNRGIKLQTWDSDGFLYVKKL